MIQLLEESKGDLIAFRLSGEIDKSDYSVMLPVMEEKIRQYKKVAVYAELMEVKGASLKALWDDLRFDFKHATDFKKAALVGDAEILDWLTVMANPFTSAKVKRFEFNQRAEAMAWVLQPE